MRSECDRRAFFRTSTMAAGASLMVTAAGLVVGLATSAALGRYMAKLLYGVTPYDSTSYLVGPLVIVVVAVIACITPARP